MDEQVMTREELEQRGWIFTGMHFPDGTYDISAEFQEPDGSKTEIWTMGHDTEGAARSAAFSLVSGLEEIRSRRR